MSALPPPPFQMIASNGVRLRAAVVGRGPLVLFVHGFPESWFSWRHQLQPVADAGFTACAIDVRGYGGSDKPHPVSAYAIKTIAADVAGVIDALSPGAPAVLVGHDWGAPIVWASTLFHPDKVRAVAGLSVPHTRPGQMPFIDLIDKLYTQQGRFFYQAYFQEEGVAEAEFEADVRGALRRFYYSISGEATDEYKLPHKKHGEAMWVGVPMPPKPPSWLTQEEEDYYVAEFTASGFRGPLNRYRNHRQDWADLTALPSPVIPQPSLYIGGAEDPVLRFIPGVDLLKLMADVLPNNRGLHVLAGCGHWTQQERPAEVNALLIPWLRGL